LKYIDLEIFFAILQEHVNSLESIKSELNLTTEKRHDLERRLQHAQEEKDNLTLALEEASDRIHMLERHAREQDTKLEVSSTIQEIRSQVLSINCLFLNYSQLCKHWNERSVRIMF